MPTAELIRDEIAEAVPGLFPANLPDPSTIPDLYREAGIEPARHTYYDATESGSIHHCCAASIIATKLHPSGVEGMREGPTIEYARAVGISDSMLKGIADGFDSSIRWPLESNDYHVGYDYGKAAWRACVDAGLVTDPSTSVIDDPATDLQAIDACD